MQYTQSPRKLQMLKEDSLIPLKPGDQCNIKKCDLSKYSQSSDITQCTISAITNGIATVIQERTVYEVELSKLSKFQRRVGINPYPQERGKIESFASPLWGILHRIGYGREESFTPIKGKAVGEINWNPFVYDSNGTKCYYQRPFVWTLSDKQLLLESLYQGIECGRILLRQRSWESIESMIEAGETELAFADIVDGKQRLNAIIGFIEGEYPDAQGNYFADFSDEAQKRFLDHKLFAFGEMTEDTKDSDVIYQFLRLNFAGVPQSPEHLDWVKGISRKM